MIQFSPRLATLGAALSLTPSHCGSSEASLMRRFPGVRLHASEQQRDKGMKAAGPNTEASVGLPARVPALPVLEVSTYTPKKKKPLRVQLAQHVGCSVTRVDKSGLLGVWFRMHWLP